MDGDAYRVVFKKLREAEVDPQGAEAIDCTPDRYTEREEIAELRRLVLEIAEPEVTYHTTT